MRSHVAISRRSFLEKAGLGAGATMLSPIVQSLMTQAHGQTPKTKRFVLWSGGQGIVTPNITPKELHSPKDADMIATIMDGPKGWTMPEMVKPLEAYRDRMLLLDGFNNTMPKLQHTATFGAFSCLTALNGGSNEGGGSPGGITIDQYVANKLGQGTQFKSVLWGVSNAGGNTRNNIFAAGPGKPEPHIEAPGLLFRTLFGSIPQAGGVDKAGIRRRLLLDGLRADVNKLQSLFAPPERQKLEHYLLAIEEFEKRQKNSMGFMLNCKAPSMPAFDKAGQGVSTEDWMETMNEMSLLAMVCGMTNVVGVAGDNGAVHGNRGYQRTGVGSIFYSKEKGLDNGGHAGWDRQGPATVFIHAFHSTMVARFVHALMQIKEGDKTAFDNSIIVYTTDNGDGHHSDNWRWPVVVVGDGGGKLKTEGRFFRYPHKKRAFADFWCTISEALDVPSDKFGRPGNLVPMTGPLTEITA